MSLRRLLSFAALMLALSLVCAVSAFGQQPTQGGGDGQNPGPGRRGPRGPGMGPGGGMMRMLADLNLTDTQKQQVQELIHKSEETNRPMREEMRKLAEQQRQGTTLSAEDQTRFTELRTSLRAANEKLRSDVMALLTPEQRTQFEEKQKQRRENRRGPGMPGGPPGTGSGATELQQL